MRSFSILLYMDALAQGGRVTVRNSEGFTSLYVAAQNGHTDICGLLLEHGSDVNEVDLKAKHTPIHNAAVRGVLKVSRNRKTTKSLEIMTFQGILLFLLFLDIFSIKKGAPNEPGY